MAKKVISRRQVLRGVGGVTLGLPFLPSLVPGPAYGQDPQFKAPPNFFLTCTQHGAIVETTMFPSDSMLTETVDLYPGHQISRGDLARTVDGDRASLSGILSAPADRLTDEVVAKMNVLRGVDIPFYIGHHTGGHLGNFARSDVVGGAQLPVDPMPTVDQLMAWSPTFYPDLSNIRLRSITAGGLDGMSAMWSNPSDRSGTIELIRRKDDPVALFNEVFVPQEQTDSSDEMPEPSVGPMLVDRVVEQYRTLRQSDRRLSSSDRQRLDDHLDRLSELERRLKTAPTAGATCGDFTAPDWNPLDPRTGDAGLVDVIAAGFLCGTCRVAALSIYESYYSEGSNAQDWHESVAHQYMFPEAQAKLVEANQQVFERTIMRLVHALDVEDSPGNTVLDNSLLAWSMESGRETHIPRSMPITTFGSAGGRLRTGNYADYRNKSPDVQYNPLGDSTDAFLGLWYHQWMATILRSMGIPEEEWRNVPHNASAGYGHPYTEELYTTGVSSAVWEGANDMLPFLDASA